MTCAVPDCAAEVVMTGVCSGHWLEADEAAHGADNIEDELRRIRAEELEADARRVQQLREAARLRELAPQTDRVQRVMQAIVARFWQEAGDESGRNRALAGAAWAAGRLAAGGELTEDEVVQRLIAEGTSAGLSARECDYVVRSQVRRARKNPRVLQRRSEWSTEWETRW